MKVSIIIRTKNESRQIDECLRRVFGQKTKYRFEVIVIDSGSTDETVELVGKYPVKLLQIEPWQFNYGRTLNLGISQARAPYVISLSAHALPVGDSWLQNLVEPLEVEAGVAATFSREIVDEQAGVIERRRVRQLFPEQSRTFTKRSKEITFSNVSSCFRKDLVLKSPFKELPYSEDLEWARGVLREGHLIRYVADSVVIHYHNDPLRDLYRRYHLGGQADYLINGRIEKISVRTLWDLALEAAHDAVFERRYFEILLIPYYLVASLIRRSAMIVGFNRGRRDALRSSLR
jgi:rhamnosyltransferase